MINIVAIGPPGGERVSAIYRRIDFPDAEEPTVDTLLGVVRTKYKNLREFRSGRGSLIVARVSETNTERGTPPFRCLPTEVTTITGVSLHSGGLKYCGEVVAVRIVRNTRNPALADMVDIVINNGAHTATRLHYYKQEVAEAERKQAAEEVRRAKQRKPKI
jgi:hypothetical protein